MKGNLHTCADNKITSKIVLKRGYMWTNNGPGGRQRNEEVAAARDPMGLCATVSDPIVDLEFDLTGIL